MKKNLLLTTLSLAQAACAQSGNGRLTLAEQGSFAIGGTVKTSAGRYSADSAALKGSSNMSIRLPPKPAAKPCTARRRVLPNP
ncbi:hypothetical protein [Neisseria musculi]|uniref:Lipoprotein n=1 Tax=Neisseria musculi TaxID=1815583 RepID=A0A7H1MBT5_9NEIS|nr:hypothetical protein [Neisseria musculi]QNT59100.1 putative lipoprotein [Neisseria musculi]